MERTKNNRKNILALLAGVALTALLLTGCDGGGSGGGGSAPTPGNGGTKPSQTEIVDTPDKTGVSWKFAKNSASTVTLLGYSSTGSTPSGCVELPSTTRDGYQVTVIGDQALYRSSITSVVIPSTVKIIGKQAFAECAKMSDVNLPESLETIGESAFYHSGIQKVVLPTGVKTVGTAAFYNCTALTTVVINGTPVLTEDVNRGVFAGCKNLQNVQLNGNMTKIAAGMFAECQFGEYRRKCVCLLRKPRNG